MPVVLTAAVTLEHGVSEATGSGVVEHDRRRSAGAGHWPITQCERVVDATEALERVSEGVSGYSVGEVAVTPPAFHQEASSNCDRQSMRTHPVTSSVASDPVTSSLTAVRSPCEVVQLADHTAPAEMISSDDSRLRSAVQGRCMQLLRQNYSYHDIEKQLLTHVTSEVVTLKSSADTAQNTGDAQTKNQWLYCIQLMSNCSKRFCDNHQCQKGREMVRGIEESLQVRGLSSPSKEQRQVLYMLIEHGRMCQDVVICRMPWCFFFFQSSDLPYDYQITSLLRLYSSSSDGNEWLRVCRDQSANTFIQFDKRIEWPSIVGEHFDTPQPKFDFDIFDIRFNSMGYINYRAKSLTIPPELLHITQYPTQEWTVSTWKRLERLRRCKSMVNHQWVSYNSKLTTVCTISPILRVTLDTVLANETPWPLHEVWQCANKFVKATKELHHIGILYLYWKADGILFYNSEDITSVQLADFTFAVTKSQLEVDSDIGELLREALPTEVLPPEMWAADDDTGCKLGEHSDVWGIGCLLYHMIMGLPIHDDFRHDPSDQIPNKVYESLEKKLEDVRRRMSRNCDCGGVNDGCEEHVLQKLLVDKKYRISLSELEDIISSRDYAGAL